MKTYKMLLVCIAAFVGLGLALERTSTVTAQNLCPADRPCITGLWQENQTIFIRWDGHENFHHYNFRWSRPGKAEVQLETRGGSGGEFRLNNINAGVVYIVKVQGCSKSLLSSSNCTPWMDGTIKTKLDLPYGPATCKQGFVWREANAQDRVCVTPSTREQTAQDNRFALNRKMPNGGAYGPDTCKQGFVWREAFPGDHVCVPPAARTQAAEDNRLASSRRVR